MCSLAAESSSLTALQWFFIFDFTFLSLFWNTLDLAFIVHLKAMCSDQDAPVGQEDFLASSMQNTQCLPRSAHKPSAMILQCKCRRRSLHSRSLLCVVCEEGVRRVMLIRAVSKGNFCYSVHLTGEKEPAIQKPSEIYPQNPPVLSLHSSIIIKA